MSEAKTLSNQEAIGVVDSNGWTTLEDLRYLSDFLQIKQRRQPDPENDFEITYALAAPIFGQQIAKSNLKFYRDFIAGRLAEYSVGFDDEFKCSVVMFCVAQGLDKESLLALGRAFAVTESEWDVVFELLVTYLQEDSDVRYSCQEFTPEFYCHLQELSLHVASQKSLFARYGFNVRNERRLDDLILHSFAVRVDDASVLSCQEHTRNRYISIPN